MRTAVESAIERLREAGCTIHPVSLPHTRYAIPTYYLLATAEASANLARFDGVRYGFRAKRCEYPGGDVSRVAGYRFWR